MAITATITGNLLDATNTAIVGGTVTASLDNFGNNTPRITSTGVVIRPLVSTTSIAAGAFSLTLIGNDQITPSGTVYTITFADASGRAVGVGTYTFTSNGSYNLNSATPNVTFPIPASINPVNAAQIQGLPVKAATPTDGQVLKYVSANSDVEWGTAGSTVSTLGSPAYFYPTPYAGMTPLLLEGGSGGATNIDITNGNLMTTTTGVGNWVLFYLPFNITISRYRFQMDGVGTSLKFYAGLYSYSAGLPLIFDIGAVTLTAGGQYGTGAVTDPGTVFFDINRNPTSSVALTAGWYLYAWSASGTAGPSVTPILGGYDALWNETIIPDTLGLSFGLSSRRAHSGILDVTGGHLPVTIGTSNGGSTTSPPNICFFA